MKLKDIFSLLSVNQPIKIVTGKDAVLYSGAYKIPQDTMDSKILHIAHDKDGIILYVEPPFYSYDELNTKAKINALCTFMYEICGYGTFLDNDCIDVIENQLKHFWINSEYTLDIDGNWYDEEGEKI